MASTLTVAGTTSPPEPSAPGWVHALAIVTVAAAAPLFFLGADVTTKGAGMADQRAFVPFWQAIGEMLSGERSHGWLIEHSHRLAGWFIGMCGIVLTVSLWLTEKRRWVAWLGTAGLVLIIVQGLLGIFRVQLHAWMGPNLAWLHGSFAPLVLATLTAVAVVTSRPWRQGETAAVAAPGLNRLAWIACAAVYLQMVLGGMVRHRDFFWGARLHLAGAFVVLALVLLLARGLHERRPRWAWALTGIVGVQLLLGIEAWISRFYLPVLPWNQLEPLLSRPELARTLHFVLGALLFASCIGLALSLGRTTRTSEREEALA